MVAQPPNFRVRIATLLVSAVVGLSPLHASDEGRDHVRRQAAFRRHAAADSSVLGSLPPRRRGALRRWGSTRCGCATTCMARSRRSCPSSKPGSMVSAVAAITERVEIGTLVTPAGMRNPAHLGKVIASADNIAGGRVIAGLGGGWMPREFTDFGMPVPRHRRTPQAAGGDRRTAQAHVGRRERG